MLLGSLSFDAYARNLRRIMWAEFVDEQMRATRTQHFKASIVGDPYSNTAADVTPEFGCHGIRGTAPAE